MGCFSKINCTNILELEHSFVQFILDVYLQGSLRISGFDVFTHRDRIDICYWFLLDRKYFAQVFCTYGPYIEVASKKNTFA